MMMQSTINNFWRTYNSEESFLPLYLPLVIWVSSLAYSKYRGFSYHRWYDGLLLCLCVVSDTRTSFLISLCHLSTLFRHLLHDFHHLSAILLGSISLYYNDDTIFNERTAILFSSSYFIVELLYYVYRRDGVYSLHSVFCLLLGYANYTTPLCRVLRMNSRAAYCLLSNPFLHLVLTYRTVTTMALFAIVFTACRIVWLPILMQHVASAGLPWTDIRMLGMMAFYGLNLIWYYKILRILVQGVCGLSPSDAEEAKKKRV